MNPETRPYAELDETQRFELLMHPEAWPDDPAVQAELAELLEMHLALQGLDEADKARLAPAMAPRRRTSTWQLAAAALLTAALPAAFLAHRMNEIKAQTRDQARLHQVALARSQSRQWSDFFMQSASLVEEFRQNPRTCRPVPDRSLEDHNLERNTAMALMEVSHQLEAQGAPTPEADRLRTSLHGWLQEVALDEGCLTPERAQELRRLADNRNLGEGALRLGRQLKDGGS